MAAILTNRISTERQSGGSAPSELTAWLESLYTAYHRPELRGSDPMVAMDAFADASDRELVGLIAALLAYGNVKAIQRGVQDVLSRLGPEPARFLLQNGPRAIRSAFGDFRYRVTSGADMAGLLIGVKRLCESHGSLHQAFAAHVDAEHITTVPALAGFVDDLCRGAESDLYHLLPHPQRGSACKRLMLYLRWMVRCDALDPGGWSGVRPGQLVIPLDTHMHRVALRLGLTQRRVANLATALEITDAFRRIRPDDPLRYDFALTRPGILRHALPDLPVRTDAPAA